MLKLLQSLLGKAALPVMAVVLLMASTNPSQNTRQQLILGTWHASTECSQATLVFNENQTSSLHCKGAGRDTTYIFGYQLVPSGAIKFWNKKGKPKFHLIQTLTKTRLAIRPYPASKRLQESIDLIDELIFTK